MMLFKRSQSKSTRARLVAKRGTSLLLVALAGGCSAEVTRFDFPGFSLTDDKKEQRTASLQQPPDGNHGPSYLGNEGQPAGGGGYERGGYVAPRSNRDSNVAMTNLPAAAPPPTYNNERSYNPQPQTQQARPALRPGESVEVQPGDTLYGLSRRHHVSIAELMEVNGLTNPSLHPGQRIYLPEGYAVQQSEPRPVATARVPVSVPPAVAGKYDGSYTMRNGDSLYALSKSYGVPLRELQRVNGITDPRSVRVGTVLKVPGAAAGPQPITEPQVAEAAPEEEAAPVVNSTHQPTVINRRETQVAPQVARREDDLSTGAINPPKSKGSDKLRWPARGKIITGFGQRSDGTHNDGINLSVPQGTPVHAAEAGVVAYAGSELKGYGNLVLLRHDNGWVTAYAHNDQILVKRGDKVRRGDVIAKAGTTGSVDQPQLHFELRQGSEPVDPVPFLEQL